MYFIATSVTGSDGLLCLIAPLLLPPFPMTDTSGPIPTSPSLWSRWDTLVTQIVLDLIDAAGWKEIRTPSVLTKDLPLVKTPTVLLTTILAYLVIIFSTFCRRSLGVDKTKENIEIKKKDPSWLRFFMLFHNIFLVGLSTFMFIGTVYQARK